MRLLFCAFFFVLLKQLFLVLVQVMISGVFLKPLFDSLRWFLKISSFALNEVSLCSGLHVLFGFMEL